MNSGNKFDLSKVNIKFVLPSMFLIPILIYYFRNSIDKLRKSMFLYGIIASLVYGFVIGGGMFPFIRGTPFNNLEGGKMVWPKSYISHMSRYQFGLEGYIIGIANLAAGISVFIYINVQRYGFGKNKWAKYIPAWIPIVVLFISWYLIMYAYNFKNGHYNFGHVGMTG